MCCGLEKLTKTQKKSSETIYMTMLKIQPLSRVFALLLFLVFVFPCNGATGDETVVVFKGDTTKVPHLSSDGSVTKHIPKAFRVPAFVGGLVDNSEFFAVLCDAQYEDSAELPFIEPVVKTSYGDYQTWSDALIFGKQTETKKDYTVLRNITAVMKGEKIYALATTVKKSKELQSTYSGSTTEWDTIMFIGTVVKSKDSSGGGGGLSVTWETQTSLKTLLPQFVLSYNAVYFFGGVGNGVVMKDGTIVLPVQIKNGNPNNHYNQASSIIYSTDDGSSWHMGSPTRTLPSSEGSVVEWSDGKLLLSVRLDIGFRVVYETDDMGATWKEFWSFTRVWGNNPKITEELGSQGSILTASVDDKNILLVSHPLITKDTRTRETLQLWVGDGKRISCVGTISDDDKGEQTGNSILALVSEKLFVTHEINPYGNLNESDPTPGERDKVIAITPMQGFFDSAKKTVREWWQLDEWFESNGIQADALVGVLGNTTANAVVWPDVYKCVNGIVSNSQSVPGGFRFNGSPDSYAKWPVENQGQNQVYKFTDKQFTLAATVIIHGTSTHEHVSCFGVGETIHRNGLLFGLGYTKDKKWSIMHATHDKKDTVVSFEFDKEYEIAITFVNGMYIMYVDGGAITGKTAKANTPGSVDYFYMGGTGAVLAAEGSLCTVKNVMLFNRSFNPREIARLAHVMKYGNTDEPTTTEEPVKLTEKPETVQAVETTSAPGNKATPSTTDATTVEDNQAKVPIPDKTKLTENEKIDSPPSTINPTEYKEPPSAGEEQIVQNIDKTVSTAATTSLQVHEDTVSTTEKATLKDNEEITSTTDTTKLLEKPKTPKTGERTSVPKIKETVSTTSTTKLSEDKKVPSNAEETSLPHIEKILFTKETTSTQENKETLLTKTTAKLRENQKIVSTTDTTKLSEKPKRLPLIQQTFVTTQPTNLPEIINAVPATERKETAVTGKQALNNGSKKVNIGDFLQRDYNKTVLEEQMNYSDSTSVPLAFVKVMCIIFSIIVLTGV